MSRNKSAMTIKILLIILLVVWVFTPIVWIIMTSLKTGGDVTAYPPKLMFKPSLENYQNIFNRSSFYYTLANSLVVAVFNVLVVMITGTLAAYGFSRFKIKGKKHIMFWIISTRMFPPVVASIPFFIMFRSLGIMDTPLALIIAYITFNLPFVIWMMKGFFDEVPVSIEESARVDGANSFQAFYKVSLPIVRPGLAATAIFTFIMSWNEFLFALIFTGKNAKTLPVNITEYLRWGEGIFWGEISAMAVLILVPVLILALSVQKHLVKGMAFGGIKG